MREYAQIVGDRRWLALAVAVTVVVGAAFYCLSATPLYEARAQLMIQPENPNVVAFKEVIEEQASKTDYYQTQYQILRSRSLARTTLDALKLWNHPEFQARPERSGPLARVLGASFSDAPVPSEGDAAEPRQGETAAESRTIGKFLTRLAVEPIRNSRLVNVRFRSSDPLLCADVVNTLTRAHIERSLEFKSMASREALEWLDTRLAQQRQGVEASERALQRYRAENDGLSLEERQNIVVQRLADLSAAQTRAKAERIDRESLYEQLQRIEQSNAIGAVPPGVSTLVIEQLRAELAQQQQQQMQLSTELGERHPQLIALGEAIQNTNRRLQEEINRHVQSVHSEVVTARARERNLSAALDEQKGDALALDRKAIEYSVLQREASSNRQMFESLLQRAKETAVSGELRTSNIRVVDAADVPLSTVYPQRGRIIPVAVVTGIGLGLAVALLLGHLDDRVKSPEHVRRVLDLPFLGFAPSLPRQATKHGDLVLNNGVPAEFAEALRLVRTNLSFCCREPTSRFIVLTSASRGEGKTLLATNLALALAQARQRVLLVDGDMRRPRLHQIFQLSRAPGLSNILEDSANLPWAIRETGIHGLHVVTAGTEPPNPADLLGLDPIGQLSALVEQQFDWVLIDSPPAGEVADACLFAHGNARVLFVVRGGGVSRRAASAALDRLAGASATFAGAVLTRVNQSGSYNLSY